MNHTPSNALYSPRTAELAPGAKRTWVAPTIERLGVGATEAGKGTNYEFIGVKGCQASANAKSKLTCVVPS